jgi:hypothetical protein
MNRRLLVLAVLAGLAAAADKPAPSGRAENADVALEAEVYTSKEDVQRVVGNDLGGFYVVVKATLKPKTRLKVLRDDFVLRTDRDGEKSKPYSSSEIAGSGVIVVSQTYGGGGVMEQPNGPPFGGVWGPPMQLPGQGSGIGNSGSEVSNQTTADSGRDRKENPLMKVLETKIFPEKETSDSLSGLLYFPMEAKQKAKQLELYFQAPSGRISLRFK